MYQCEKCGRFLKNIKAFVNGFTGSIKKVVGDCKKCGKNVDVDDWYGGDFGETENKENG